MGFYLHLCRSYALTACQKPPLLVHLTVAVVGAGSGHPIMRVALILLSERPHPKQLRRPQSGSPSLTCRFRAPRDRRGAALCGRAGFCRRYHTWRFYRWAGYHGFGLSVCRGLPVSRYVGIPKGACVPRTILPLKWRAPERTQSICLGH